MAVGSAACFFFHSLKLTTRPLRVALAARRAPGTSAPTRPAPSASRDPRPETPWRASPCARARIDEVDAHGGIRRARARRSSPALRAPPSTPHMVPSRRTCRVDRAGGDEHRAPCFGALQQRIERADQPPVGRQVDVDHRVPGILGHVVQRRQRPEDAGVADEDVELAPALEQRRPELIDLVALGEVELQQRRLAAALADLVVELLRARRWCVRRRSRARRAAARARATARPMPREAPVTRASRSLSGFLFFMTMHSLAQQPRPL